MQLEATKAFPYSTELDWFFVVYTSSLPSCKLTCLQTNPPCSSSRSPPSSCLPSPKSLLCALSVCDNVLSLQPPPPPCAFIGLFFIWGLILGGGAYGCESGIHIFCIVLCVFVGAQDFDTCAALCFCKGPSPKPLRRRRLISSHRQPTLSFISTSKPSLSLLSRLTIRCLGDLT